LAHRTALRRRTPAAAAAAPPQRRRSGRGLVKDIRNAAAVAAAELGVVPRPAVPCGHFACSPAGRPWVETPARRPSLPLLSNVQRNGLPTACLPACLPRREDRREQVRERQSQLHCNFVRFDFPMSHLAFTAKI